MRYTFAALLALSLAAGGCASTREFRFDPETWYIAPEGQAVFAFAAPSGSAPLAWIQHNQRFQIVGRTGNFFIARTSVGDSVYVSRNVPMLTVYDPATHGDVAQLDAEDTQRMLCRDFPTQGAAQAAFAAGQAALDSDGDGVACDRLRQTEQGAVAPATGSRGGDVQVRGHWRRNADGSRTYVRPHTRSRPRSRGR